MIRLWKAAGRVWAKTRLCELCHRGGLRTRLDSMSGMRSTDQALRPSKHKQEKNHATQSSSVPRIRRRSGRPQHCSRRHDRSRPERSGARSKLRKTITDLFNAASDGRQNGGKWVSLWSISNARLKAVPEDQRGQDEGSPNRLPRRQIPWFWILDSAKGKRGVDRARSAAQEVP